MRRAVPRGTPTPGRGEERWAEYTGTRSPAAPADGMPPGACSYHALRVNPFRCECSLIIKTHHEIVTARSLPTGSTAYIECLRLWSTYHWDREVDRGAVGDVV